MGQVVEDVANVALQATTGGLVGIEDGGIAPGLIGGGVLHAVDEGLGEITGRNLQREQIGKQEARLREAEAQAERDLELEQLQEFRSQVAASRGVEAIRSTQNRSTRNRRAGGGRGGRTPSLGTEERQFLGL